MTLAGSQQAQNLTILTEGAVLSSWVFRPLAFRAEICGRGQFELYLPLDPPKQTLSEQGNHRDPSTSALLEQTLASQWNLPQFSIQGQAKAKASAFRYQMPLLRRNEQHCEGQDATTYFRPEKQVCWDQERGLPNRMKRAAAP